MIEPQHATARSRRFAPGQRPTSRIGAAILVLFVSGVAVPCAAAALPAPDRGATPSLEALVAGPQRSPAHRARDPYRHPLDDLHFFGIKPQDAVVEILPGGGAYWTEILAPYLRDRGRYVAANPPKTDTSDESVTGNAAFAAKLAADPADLGKVEVAEFAPSRDLVPPGSADVVLTFRNVHNWMADGTAQAVVNRL